MWYMCTLYTYDIIILKIAHYNNKTRKYQGGKPKQTNAASQAVLLLWWSEWRRELVDTRLRSRRVPFLFSV